MPRTKQTEATFSTAAFARLLGMFPKNSAAYIVGQSLGTPYPASPAALSAAIAQAPEWLCERLEALQVSDSEAVREGQEYGGGDDGKTNEISGISDLAGIRCRGATRVWYKR